jgi:hypothetical protein
MRPFHCFKDDGLEYCRISRYHQAMNTQHSLNAIHITGVANA